MKRISTGLWLATAVVGAMAGFGLSCGDGGGGGATCTTDSSCGTGKLCHPVKKTCVTSCTVGSDCPSEARTCRTFAGADPVDGGVGFCQCSTPQLCGANRVCMALTKTCEDKCTATSCWGGTCDTATGQCSGGTTDAGVCTYGSATVPAVNCASGLCNYATNQCMAALSCNAANPQPDTCTAATMGGGGFCNAGTCSQVRLPTCSNFTPGTGHTPSWNPAGTGPVIWKIEPGTPNPTFCFRGYFNHSMDLRAYRTDRDFPTILTDLSGFFYVTSRGAVTDGTAGIPGGAYSPNGRNMTLRLYLCAATAAPFNAGYYFTNGNEACYSTSGAVAGTTPCTTNANCGGAGAAKPTCNTTTGTCE